MASNLEKSGIEQEKNISVLDLDKFNIGEELDERVEKSVFFRALHSGNASSGSYLVIPKEGLINNNFSDNSSIFYENKREKLSQARFVSSKTKFTKDEAAKLFVLGEAKYFFDKYGDALEADDFAEKFPDEDINDENYFQKLKKDLDAREGI